MLVHALKGLSALLIAAGLLDPGPSFNKLGLSGRIVIWLIMTAAIVAVTW